MKIKSAIKNYSVTYTKNFSKELKNLSLEHECFYVIDKNVYSLYLDFLKFIPDNRLYLVEANEYNKTFEGCNKLMLFLLKNSFKRKDKLVAIGGGIIQDITCFVASIIILLGG